MARRALIATTAALAALGLAPAAAHAVPVFQIADVTAVEGSGGFTQFDFVVTTSEPPQSSNSTVQFRVLAGTATAGRDFLPVTGTLTFVQPDRSETITVRVDADTTPEASETFTVELFNARGAGALIGDGVGEGTILDDDGPLTVSLADVRVQEGPGAVAAVPIRLSHGSDGPITVSVRTLDRTALAPADYAPFAGSFTFAAGQQEGSLVVPVTDDEAGEGDETFGIEVSSDADVSVPPPATITIADDDVGSPSVSIGRPRRTSRAALRVLLRCAAGGAACDGRLSGTSRGRSALRQAAVDLDPGASQTLTLRLGRATARRLANGERIVLVLSVRLRDPFTGTVSTTRRRVVLSGGRPR